MGQVQPAASHQLIEAAAAILQCLLVDVCDLATLVVGPDQDRRAVGHLSETLFAFRQ
jgi:hypothetical protein